MMVRVHVLAFHSAPRRPEVPASSQAMTGGVLGSIPRFSQCTGTHRTASSEGGSGEFVNTFPRHTNSADGGEALQA